MEAMTTHMKSVAKAKQPKEEKQKYKLPKETREKEKQDRDKHPLWAPWGSSRQLLIRRETYTGNINNDAHEVAPDGSVNEEKEEPLVRLSFIKKEKAEKKKQREAEELAALKSRVEEIYFWQFNQTYPKQKQEKFVTVHIDDSVGLCLEVRPLFLKFRCCLFTIRSLFRPKRNAWSFAIARLS